MRIAALTIVFLCIFLSEVTAQKRVTGIIGAMPEEISMVLDSLKNRKDTLIKGQHFYSGTLKNKEVVIVESGIGKVNAAFSTTLLIGSFPIDQVIFTGVAGGLNPAHYPGDIIIGTSVFHHDFGVIDSKGFRLWQTRNVIDKVQNPLEFICDPDLVSGALLVAGKMKLEQVERRTPAIYPGKIATGDVFVSSKEKAGWLFKETGAFATEMEGAAVAQLCHQLKIPFLIIRSLSDNANNEAHTDYNTFKVIASHNSAKLLLRILESN
jgi:adenosylhomocysteine nucleosidase